MRRTKGWRKPDGAIVVARPSKWGNPYTIEREGRGYTVIDRARDSILGTFHSMYDPPNMGARYWSVQGYKLHLGRHPELADAARRELAGRDLACWCPLDQPCHADVLLELANRGDR